MYSKSYAEVDAAAHDIWEMINAKRAVLPGNVAVGFDLEWKASFQRGLCRDPWSLHGAQQPAFSRLLRFLVVKPVLTDFSSFLL